MLYKSREIVNVLNEPESVMIRRKELVNQIKVLREAQKIIRRDPDLMQVMQININDSDITGHGKDSRNIHHEEEEPKKESTVSSTSSYSSKPAVTTSTTVKTEEKKPPKTFNSLFGTTTAPTK